MLSAGMALLRCRSTGEGEEREGGNVVGEDIAVLEDDDDDSPEKVCEVGRWL